MRWCSGIGGCCCRRRWCSGSCCCLLCIRFLSVVFYCMYYNGNALNNVHIIHGKHSRGRTGNIVSNTRYTCTMITVTVIYMKIETKPKTTAAAVLSVSGCAPWVRAQKQSSHDAWELALCKCVLTRPVVHCGMHALHDRPKSRQKPNDDAIITT